MSGIKNSPLDTKISTAPSTPSTAPPTSNAPQTPTSVSKIPRRPSFIPSRLAPTRPTPRDSSKIPRHGSSTSSGTKPTYNAPQNSPSYSDFARSMPSSQQFRSSLPTNPSHLAQSTTVLEFLTPTPAAKFTTGATHTKPTPTQVVTASKLPTPTATTHAVKNAQVMKANNTTSTSTIADSTKASLSLSVNSTSSPREPKPVNESSSTNATTPSKLPVLQASVGPAKGRKKPFINDHPPKATVAVDVPAAKETITPVPPKPATQPNPSKPSPAPKVPAPENITLLEAPTPISEEPPFDPSKRLFNPQSNEFYQGRVSHIISSCAECSIRHLKSHSCAWEITERNGDKIDGASLVVSIHGATRGTQAENNLRAAYGVFLGEGAQQNGFALIPSSLPQNRETAELFAAKAVIEWYISCLNHSGRAGGENILILAETEFLVGGIYGEC